MQLVRGKDDNSQEASMTHAVKGRSRRGRVTAGVFGVALATALTLGGSEEATAQSAGPDCTVMAPDAAGCEGAPAPVRKTGK